MYSPVWLVVIEEGNERITYRVDAVNGTIIRQPITPPTPSQNGQEELEPEIDEEDLDESFEPGE